MDSIRNRRVQRKVEDLTASEKGRGPGRTHNYKTNITRKGDEKASIEDDLKTTVVLTVKESLRKGLVSRMIQSLSYDSRNICTKIN